jgi:short-subunit dehydrogenase
MSRALITGASGGIGEELARLFAADRWNLVLVARSKSRLESLASEMASKHGIQARALAIDLAAPGAAEGLHAELASENVQVDALVNNAGFTVHGRFAETEWSNEAAMLQVNVIALTALTKLFVRDMLARRSGRILNVASTAAFAPGPMMAVYYASKAYVLSFSRALADELRGSGVTVTVLCPGPTRTGFAQRGGVEETPLFRGPVMDARTVAKAGYRGMLRGRPLVVPGVRNRLQTMAMRKLPTAVITRAVRRAHDRG